MTFEEWYGAYAHVAGEYSPANLARMAWKAATTAERERCAKIAEELGFANLATKIRKPEEE